MQASSCGRSCRPATRAMRVYAGPASQPNGASAGAFLQHSGSYKISQFSEIAVASRLEEITNFFGNLVKQLDPLPFAGRSPVSHVNPF